jgi:DNA-binding transcriptional ArsR family regulator
MPDKKPDTETETPNLRRMLAHPLRIEIMTLLRKKGNTEAFLAREMEQSAAVVAYHLRVMEDCEVVAEAENPREGCSERYLILTPIW